MFRSSTEKFDFSDMNDYPGEGKGSRYRLGSDGKSCHLSITTGFILTFLALAIAVGVGIIVHFAGSDKSIVCSCQCLSQNGSTTEYPPGYVPDICRYLANNGNQELCGLCPGFTTRSTTVVDITSATTKVPSTTSTTSTASTASTTSTPPSITTDILLPKAIKPQHYDIRLRAELYNGFPETFTFNGSVTILVECITATDNITLHIGTQNLTATPLVEPMSNVTEVNVVNTTRDLERQFLILHLDRELAAEHNYTIYLQFTDHLTDNLKGLYLSSYFSEMFNATKFLAVTQFQHTFARNAFPCFDEPALKAKFSVTLERQPQISTWSNMPLNKTEILADGYLADIYDESVIMSTYLVAFAFCDFLNVTNTTASGTELGVLSRPEYINQTEYGLHMGSIMLDAFENYFNISFTLPKVDNIALPDFYYGAMENWGLVTYREAYLLFEEGMTTTRSEERIAEIIAHELAHMWFGNLVSPAWWDDIWLNEGFATFLSYLCMDMVLPEWKMMDLITTYEVQRVMEFDSLESTVPIYRLAYTPVQIDELFDIITYSKGASVIRMMWFFLGEDTFRKGLEGYLKRQSFGVVTHANLWDALEQQAVQDGKTNFSVKTVVDTWIKQKNFPVVNVTRSSGQLRLTQQRFLLRGDNKSMDSSIYSWEIPFTYTSNREAVFNKTANDIHWIGLHSPETIVTDGTIQPDNGWIIANIQQYGYYRANYDKENWQALTQQLKDDHEKIHVVNRAALISDAWALAKAGLIEMRIAWDMLTYLQNETEYLPWNIVAQELNYVDNMLNGRAAYGNFERFVVKQIEGRDLNVSLNDRRPVQQRSLSSLIFSLACHHHVGDCIKLSVEMFDQWRYNGTLIPPDIKGTVMCTAVREGGEEEWDYVYNRYKNGPASESRLALSAMGCSTRPWIINRYLDYSLQQDKIRRQDVLFAFLSVVNNPVTFYMAWKFIFTNWQYLVVHHTNDMNSLLVPISQGLYTEFELSQMLHLRDNIHPPEIELSGFTQAIERIMVNMEWEKNNYEFIEQWLDENTAETV